MWTYCLIETQWGAFGLMALGETLVRTCLPAEPSRVIHRFLTEQPEACEDSHALPSLQEDVRRYFAGDVIDFDVEIGVDHLTPFQRRVIQACRAIPYGTTTSYGQLAARAGSPRAARAVGSVMACNRFPLVVPCHRVLASDGSVGGFSSPGGLADKHRLLGLEQAGLDHPQESLVRVH